MLLLLDWLLFQYMDLLSDNTGLAFFQGEPGSEKALLSTDHADHYQDS